MAQIGVAIVGGIIGSFFGMPQLGFMAGGLIGGMIFGSGSSGGGGPRLNDLRVTSSAYGADIPVVYGTARISGNMIWGKDIRESKQSSGGGGKGLGGGGSSTTTYRYYGSFAIAFCEGPIAGFLKIWADGKLIWDATRSESRNRPTVNNNKYRMRFYTGTEDQQPDPLIVKNVDKAHGANSTPAFRGLAYIVFDDIPLKDLGNHIPNISVLLTTDPDNVKQSSAANSQFNDRTFVPRRFRMLNGPSDETGIQGVDTTIVSNSIGVTDGPTTIAGFAADWTRRKMYAWPTGTTTTDNFISIVDPDLMTELKRVTYPNILDASETLGTYIKAVGTGPSGTIYAALNTAGNYNRIIKINPDTMKQITPGFGAVDPNGTTINDARHHVVSARNVSKLFEIKVTGGTSGVEYFVVVIGQYGWPMILKASNMTYLWGGYKDTSAVSMTDYLTGAFPSTANGAIICVPGAVRNGSSDIGVINYNRTSNGEEWFDLYTITVAAGASYSSGTQSNGVAVTHRRTIHPTDLDSDWDDNYNMVIENFQYDPTDDTYMFSLHRIQGNSPRGRMVKWSMTDGYKWVTDIGSEFDSNGPYQNISGGQMGLITSSGSNAFYLFDTSAGTINRNGNGSSPGLTVTEQATQVFEAKTNAQFYVSSGGIRKIAWAGTDSNIGGLRDVVTDVCLRSGIPKDYIDVTRLNDESVYGYVVSKNSTGKEILLQLAGLHFFDAAEMDDSMAFVSKGQDPIVEIPQQWLGSSGDSGDGDYWVVRRAQEHELPLEIDIKYFDVNADYQEGMQTNRRVGIEPLGWKTSWSINKLTIEAPAAMTAALAATISQKTLFTAYVERDTFKTKLPWRYMWLTPVDVVTVALDDGATYEVRLGKMDMGADYVMEVDAVAQSMVSYASNAEGQDAGTLEQPNQTSDLYARYLIFEVPLLRDVDDTGGLYGRRYFAAGKYSDNWPGGQVNISSDNVSYSAFDDSLTATPDWGTVVGTLGTTAEPFSTDFTNTITVAFRNWVTPPSTITDLELLNGGNTAIVGDEVIQFRDVTDNEDGTYTLSTLLRGRRGTEWAVGTHLSGENFVIVTPTTMDIKSVATSERNALRYFRLVSDGSYLEESETVSATYLGRDLMPYAPVNFKRQISGSDLAISWSRRSRVAGELMDGTGDVPLGETTESYEIYILSAAYNPATFDATNAATYVRKLTSTTPTVTYTAANMTTDGFTAATSTLYGVGFQISSVVGRGFAGPFVVPA